MTLLTPYELHKNSSFSLLLKFLICFMRNVFSHLVPQAIVGSIHAHKGIDHMHSGLFAVYTQPATQVYIKCYIIPGNVGASLSC